MGFHQIGKLLHSKLNNHHGEEIAYKMEENLYQLLIQQGIHIKNIQRTQKIKQVSSQ
jgi:hypothetical protein